MPNRGGAVAAPVAQIDTGGTSSNMIPGVEPPVEC
jgi:hypothetical protein